MKLLSLTDGVSTDPGGSDSDDGGPPLKKMQPIRPIPRRLQPINGAVRRPAGPRQLYQTFTPSPVALYQYGWQGTIRFPPNLPMAAPNVHPAQLAVPIRPFPVTTTNRSYNFPQFQQTLTPMNMQWRGTPEPPQFPVPHNVNQFTFSPFPCIPYPGGLLTSTPQWGVPTRLPVQPVNTSFNPNFNRVQYTSGWVMAVPAPQHPNAQPNAQFLHSCIPTFPARPVPPMEDDRS